MIHLQNRDRTRSFFSSTTWFLVCIPLPIPAQHLHHILQLPPLQDGVSSVMSCFATGQRKILPWRLMGKLRYRTQRRLIDGVYVESIVLMGYEPMGNSTA